MYKKLSFYKKVHLKNILITFLDIGMSHENILAIMEKIKD